MSLRTGVEKVPVCISCIVIIVDWNQSNYYVNIGSKRYPDTEFQFLNWRQIFCPISKCSLSGKCSLILWLPRFYHRLILIKLLHLHLNMIRKPLEYDPSVIKDVAQFWISCGRFKRREEILKSSWLTIFNNSLWTYLYLELYFNWRRILLDLLDEIVSDKKINQKQSSLNLFRFAKLNPVMLLSLFTPCWHCE